MKKRFLLLAMALFTLVGGAFAAELSYTITFKEWSQTGKDNSQKVTAIADIIASGAEYVSAIPTATNIYNARVGRGIKFGTTSKTGELVLTLATPVKPTRIVANARQYDSDETTLKFNDKTFILSSADFQDQTVTYDGNTEVTQIKLATTSKRNYVKSVTVYYEGTVAAVEKPVITPASYEGFDAQEVTITCATADAKVYYTLDGTEPVPGSSTEYTAPFTVSEAVTVKAIAAKESDTSAVATANLTILKKIANTQEAPYTVAEANALAKNTDAASLKHANNKVYIKGIVTAITEVSTEFGNATYTIADETGATETLSVYRGKYLNDTKFDETNKDELAVGKEVVVYGNLSMYKEAPQVAQYNWLVSITTPVVPATPELKITSELKEGTDELGDPYKYIDFGTVEYGQTASVVIAIEGKNLPAKVTTYPDGITEEIVDNYVTFALSTYPFFDVEIEGGKAETVIDPWFGSEMTNYTFPVAADGSVKGSVTLKVKKDFGADPFDEANGYGLPEGEAVAIGNLAFRDESYATYTDFVTVVLTLKRPAGAVVPELKITSEVKQGTDDFGDSYTYLDFGTVEYGQTSSVSISFEGKNLPAKVVTYPDGITEETVDNYITVHLSTYPFFDVELSEGGKAETIIDQWFGEEMTFYTFPIAADGSVKGSVTLKVKKDFGADPFDEENGYGIPEGEAQAIGNIAFGDQSYAYVTDPVTLMLTLTKPNQGGDDTALENATIEAKAVKVIENGVVYIIKNGVKYTVTGVAVK